MPPDSAPATGDSSSSGSPCVGATCSVLFTAASGASVRSAFADVTRRTILACLAPSTALVNMKYVARLSRLKPSTVSKNSFGFTPDFANDIATRRTEHIALDVCGSYLTIFETILSYIGRIPSSLIECRARASFNSPNNRACSSARSDFTIGASPSGGNTTGVEMGG